MKYPNNRMLTYDTRTLRPVVRSVSNTAWPEPADQISDWETWAAWLKYKVDLSMNATASIEALEAGAMLVYDANEIIANEVYEPQARPQTRVLPSRKRYVSEWVKERLHALSMITRSK